MIACLLTVFVVSLLKGKLSEEDPTHGQLTLEAGYLAISDLVGLIIGDQRAHIWSRDICGPDTRVELDGAVPYVRIADRFGERDIRSRHLVVRLLQL